MRTAFEAKQEFGPQIKQLELLNLSLDDMGRREMAQEAFEKYLQILPSKSWQQLQCTAGFIFEFVELVECRPAE